jgi:hypothetical protein
VTRFAALLGKQGVRLVLLVVILGLSGVFLGLAAGYPLSKIQFEESDAVRLDQSQLAGEVDPAAAVVTSTDLPIGWEDGDPAIAAFGLLGTEFCGEEVPLPTQLSEVESAVFANPADESILIAQAVRVDRWQNARTYVDDVGSAVGECEQFFRNGLDGSRVQVDIEDGTSEPPITDYVSRSFVAQDGESVQTWSMMAVGDVVIALLYNGPTAPQQGFLSELEDQLLARLDPQDFAPGGVAPSTSTTTTVDPTATTVLEGGAADETEAPAVPEPVEGGEPGN